MIIKFEGKKMPLVPFLDPGIVKSNSLFHLVIKLAFVKDFAKKNSLGVFDTIVENKYEFCFSFTFLDIQNPTRL